MEARSYQRKLDVHGPRTALGYVIAVLGTAAATIGLLAVRPDVSKTNVVLTFLAVVVAAAATGGLGPGAVAAAAGFLAFDILFIPPYYTLVVNDRQDYLSLAVFLLTAFVVSYLVGALERRRIQAERREQETRTLYELSTSLVAHGSLDDTLNSVVRTVRSLFNLAGCAIVLPDGRDGVRIAARDGEIPLGLDRILAPTSGSGLGGRLQPGHALTVPLRAGAEPVGALVVVAGGPGSPSFGEAERRLLATFANQAALAVEQGRQEEERSRTRALEETDRLRTALLNSVSHDLRTPLASIKASASSLLDREVQWDESERQEFLTTIDQEADRLTRLVHNLLDMSRIEANALDPRVQETSLPRSPARWCGGPAPRAASGSTCACRRRSRPCSPTRSCWSRWSPTCWTTRSATPRAAPSPWSPASWRTRSSCGWSITAPASPSRSGSASSTSSTA
jgi:two-component system sensor histidine kinase KdpD